MSVSLDPRKAFLTRQHGDLVAVYTWVNDERALVLIPAFRARAPWYIVMESAAFKYDDPAYLARQGKIACEVLGLEPSLPNWVRVATIINEGLPDLCSMPSAPVAEQHAAGLGEMTVKMDGEVVAQQVVREDIQGATYG